MIRVGFRNLGHTPVPQLPLQSYFRQGGPVRRVVQPQIVSHKTKPSSQTGEFQEPQLGQSNNQVLTTAAAASAAVAATQPFLKVGDTLSSS